MAPSRQTAVFAYGSLVDHRSAGLTLGRELPPLAPALIAGWRRRFSQARDNHNSEKTFARTGDGTTPSWILGLNLERDETVTTDGTDEQEAPNGALIPVDEQDLKRLDLREVRYRRVDVTAAIQQPEESRRFERIITYVSRPENLAVEARPGSVILNSYAATIERAFALLGADQLARYRRTTLPLPVQMVEGELAIDRIPDGNPRDW